MTNKIQKIREGIEKLKSNLIHGACSSQVAMETRCKEEAYNEVLAILDNTQEEPVSEELEEEIEKYMNALYRNWTEDERSKDSDVEELCKQTARHFTNWQKQKDSIVSDDLEEASKEWLKPQLDKSYAEYGEVKMMELTHFDGYAMLDAIEFGAKWQKTKDESTTEDLGEYINELSKQFPEVSFAKLSRIGVRVAKWQKQQDNNDANHALVWQIKTQQMCYEKGMVDMKQQMMAKTIDVEVKVDAGGYTYIPQMELYDYDKDVPLAKEGDKYKVVLIKEE